MNNPFAEHAVSSAFAQADIAFQANLYNDPNPTRRGLHRHRRAWVENRLDRHVTQGLKVLEVGVGCGIFTRYIADRGAAVVAVDINQAFLDGVQGVAGVQTLSRDATQDLGLHDMDVALLSEVLEHVPPERSGAMLGALYRALRPGGVLILSTPQRYSTMERTAALLRFPPVLALARRIYGAADELGHINLLTRGQLGRQLRAAGFDILEQDRFGFYLPIIAEFGGKAGAALLQGLGRALNRIPILNHLIWTQAYVLRKPAGS